MHSSGSAALSITQLAPKVLKKARVEFGTDPMHHLVQNRNTVYLQDKTSIMLLCKSVIIARYFIIFISTFEHGLFLLN